MQAKHEADWETFSPNEFRHMHVDHQVSRLLDLVLSGGEQGLAMLGDASIMRNTMGPTWEQYYLKNAYTSMFLKASMNHMAKWRHHHLESMALALKEQLAGYPSMFDGYTVAPPLQVPEWDEEEYGPMPMEFEGNGVDDDEPMYESDGGYAYADFDVGASPVEGVDSEAVESGDDEGW